MWVLFILFIISISRPPNSQWFSVAYTKRLKRKQYISKKIKEAQPSESLPICRKSNWEQYPESQGWLEETIPQGSTDPDSQSWKVSLLNWWDLECVHASDLPWQAETYGEHQGLSGRKKLANAGKKTWSNCSLAKDHWLMVMIQLITDQWSWSNWSLTNNHNPIDQTNDHDPTDHWPIITVQLIK